MDSVTSYAKKVVAGKIIAGDSVKKACKRHLKDLKKSKRKDYPYYFDAEQADIVLHSLKITADTAKKVGRQATDIRRLAEICCRFYIRVEA